MNLIDIGATVIFLLYTYEDYVRGFLRSLADLIGMVLAFLFALSFYANLANLLAGHVNWQKEFIAPISFLIIWLGFQFIFFLFSKLLSHFTPGTIKNSKLNKYLAILPAAIRGMIFVGIMMILLVVMPLGQKDKIYISDSLIGKLTLNYAVKAEDKMEKVFGNPTFKTLTFAANHQMDEPMIALKFSTTNMAIDEDAEQYIFDQINIERAKVGLNQLTTNPLIRNVARAHSRDMLVSGYFSHDTLDGKTLFDRLLNSNVVFREAAENLALAPTPPLAQTGLMNSPKHRENILDPAFTAVGVGVMNAGEYGLMVTEDFTN